MMQSISKNPAPSDDHSKSGQKKSSDQGSSGSFLQMEPLRSAEEAVTEALRKAIHRGDLKPGQRLSQADLAEQLGVSRIPLRDALRRLEAESLVRMDGRKGTWVSDLSLSGVEEIYAIRLMLEEHCAERAVERISDEELKELLVLFDAMDSAEQDPEARDFDARRNFYTRFYSYSDRPMMTNQILLLRDNVGRYHKFKDTGHGHADHLEFRDALVKRDGKRAARVLRRHLEDARDDLLKDMQAALGAKE